MILNKLNHQYNELHKYPTPFIYQQRDEAESKLDIESLVRGFLKFELMINFFIDKYFS
jgi:hypothetical protein